MDAIECILSRRSVRRYTTEPIRNEDLQTIWKSAIAAPSGKNGQPWRFKAITDGLLIRQISLLSPQNTWVRLSPCLIAVFLDKSCSYDHLKDVQSCGAVMQNMLLCAHALNMGSCWIGGILDKSDELKMLLCIEKEELELMGVIALGYVTEQKDKSVHRSIESFLL